MATDEIPTTDTMPSISAEKPENSPYFKTSNKPELQADSLAGYGHGEIDPDSILAWHNLGREYGLGGTAPAGECLSPPSFPRSGNAPEEMSIPAKGLGKADIELKMAPSTGSNIMKTIPIHHPEATQSVVDSDMS